MNGDMIQPDNNAAGGASDAQPPSPAPLSAWPEGNSQRESRTIDSSAVSAPTRDDQPVAVVQALSVRGVEYAMMTLSLWFAAGALAGVLLSIFNGGTSFSVLSFPLALLLVCVPVFSFFFIRLKRAEIVNPALRFDPSKRRLTQFTQIIAFAICLFNLIGFIYLVLQKIGGESTMSLGKAFLNLLVILVVAGGVLAYYWFDEHRLVK